MSSSQVMTVLIQDPDSRNALYCSQSVRVVHQSDLNLESVKNLFVLTSATGLLEVADLVKIANQKHHLRVLFIREDIDSKWLPQMFDRANLRIMRNTLIHEDLAIPQRVINAWDWEAQDQLIADAMVIRDTKDTHCDRLLVFSCAMEKFEVSFDDLPALQSIPQEERTKFTIAEDGSYLYWEKPDIHLDLDTLRCAVDRAWKKKFDTQKLIHNQLFGQAIAALRKQYKLRQSDIIGLSERQVSRIEKGQGTKLETLALFAKAHGMELNDYLEAVANLIPDVPDKT